MDYRPLIIAHRGASLQAPENTLAAFRAAREAGADWIELDVQMTADGELVCLHDHNLQRTTGVDADVSALTLSNIRTLDAGSWFSPEFAGEPVPTLADALAEARRERPLGVLIEIKDADRYGSRVAELVRSAITIVRASVPVDDGLPFGGVALQSFRPQIVQLLAMVGPELSRIQLAPPFATIIPSMFPSPAAAFAFAASYADGLALPEEEIDVEVLSHCAGTPVLAWTVNDPARMRALTSLGVAGIITDDPASVPWGS